jgi:hypothetical protein
MDLRHCLQIIVACDFPGCKSLFSFTGSRWETPYEARSRGWRVGENRRGAVARIYCPQHRTKEQRHEPRKPHKKKRTSKWDSLLSALLQARATGSSFQEIADQHGVSRQYIHQVLKRGKEP